MIRIMMKTKAFPDYMMFAHNLNLEFLYEGINTGFSGVNAAVKGR